MTNFNTEICTEISGSEDDLRSLYQMLDVINNYWDDEDISADYLVEHFPWAAPSQKDAEVLCEMALEIEGCLGVDMRIEDDKLLLITDESVAIECLTRVIKSWLSMLKSEEYVAIEFANTADRAIPGGFSGGAVFITRHDIQSTDTKDWIKMKASQLEAERSRDNDLDRIF